MTDQINPQLYDEQAPSNEVVRGMTDPHGEFISSEDQERLAEQASQAELVTLLAAETLSLRKAA